MNLSERVREFLEEPRLCVMATINRDGTPQMTAMWYDLVDEEVIMNTTRDLIKERNLRRDPRMSICVADGYRYVTLSGRAELIDDRAIQEAEVNRFSVRYVGLRLGPERWERIKHQDRVGIRMRVERVFARGLD